MRRLFLLAALAIAANSSYVSACSRGEDLSPDDVRGVAYRPHDVMQPPQDPPCTVEELSSDPLEESRCAICLSGKDIHFPALPGAPLIKKEDFQAMVDNAQQHGEQRGVFFRDKATDTARFLNAEFCQRVLSAAADLQDRSGDFDEENQLMEGFYNYFTELFECDGVKQTSQQLTGRISMAERNNAAAVSLGVGLREYPVEHVREVLAILTQPSEIKFPESSELDGGQDSLVDDLLNWGGARGHLCPRVTLVAGTSAFLVGAAACLVAAFSG